jgi:peptidoglycan hydrolase-like amidase
LGREGVNNKEHAINIGPIRNIGRCAAALACVSLGVLAGPVVLAPRSAATVRYSITPFPGRNVDFVGFGNGFGVGMGQWGAFGYAAVDHESYRWILAHYYGGTTLSTGANVVSADPSISVDLNENDGDPVVVTSPSAFSFGGEQFPGGQAVRAALSQGTWTLSQAPSCASTSWTQIASQLVNPVAVPSSLRASATSSQVLTLCEHDGADLAVSGTIEAYDAPSGAVTLNILPVEEYVRSVLSGEVSWSWGLFGGRTGAPSDHAWGFQALEAQAVATRSYVASELVSGGWAPYATACDSSCQSYSGMAGENRMLDAAAADTAGQILVRDGATATAGAPVLAEYSASTGGYTVGGPFPSVVDRGDSVCIKSRFYTCNPCHKWWASVPVSTIEKAYPSVGVLAAVEVTERNGLGPLGGRVENVALVGTNGAVVFVPVPALTALIGANNKGYCASDWYGVTNGP